jgi:hypothetical protein
MGVHILYPSRAMAQTVYTYRWRWPSHIHQAPVNLQITKSQAVLERIFYGFLRTEPFSQQSGFLCLKTEKMDLLIGFFPLFKEVIIDILKIRNFMLILKM